MKSEKLKKILLLLTENIRGAEHKTAVSQINNIIKHICNRRKSSQKQKIGFIFTLKSKVAILSHLHSISERHIYYTMLIYFNTFCHRKIVLCVRRTHTCTYMRSRMGKI